MHMRSTSIPLLAALCLALAGGTAAAAADDARLAALKQRLATMAEQTARVEAVTQLQRIGRAFGYYSDKGFFGEAADLFTDNATFQWGNDGIYRGKARIRELLTRHGGGSMKEVAGLPFGRLNLRMQLQPVITVGADGRSAMGRWREWGLLGQYKKAAYWGDAVIEDRYVLEGGVWKIAARAYYLNFEAPYQGGWAVLKPGTFTGQSAIAKEFPPDAPVAQPYKVFPAAFVPPYHYAGATPSAIQSSPPMAALPKRTDDRLGKLEAEADASELQLARARSLRAVENLHGIYGYYVDKGQWKQAAALFARNGTYEFGQGGVYAGPASIERGLSLMGPAGLEEGQLNNYVMVQPIIHVDEQNRTAKARWRNDVLLSRAGQGRWGGGVYENEYVNENGTWKISKLHYHVTFWGEYEQGWGAKPIPVEQPSTTVPPDRPPTLVYQSFPKLQVVPFHFNHPVTGKPHEVQ
jgi:hypothetical protein